MREEHKRGCDSEGLFLETWPSQASLHSLGMEENVGRCCTDKFLFNEWMHG